MKYWLKQILFTRNADINFIKNLYNDKDPKIVNIAISVLGHSGDVSFIKIFGERLLKEDRLATRIELIKAIKNFNNKNSIVYIKKRLLISNQKLPAIEEAAIYNSLGNFRTVEIERFLLDRFNRLDILRKQDSKKNLFILKKSLIYSLARVGGKLTLELFMNSINPNHHLAKYKSIIADALSEMKNADPSKFLIEIAKNSKQEVFDQVLKSFSKIGGKNAFDFLVNTYEKYKKSKKSIYYILKSLENIDYNKTKRLFVSLINDNYISFNSVTVLVSVFKREMDKEVVPLILKRLENETDLQKISIFIVLIGDLGDKASAEKLRKYLEHEATGVRFLAAEAISKITGEKIDVPIM